MSLINCGEGRGVNPHLIVDDNEQIVEILSRYIAAEGWPLFVRAFRARRRCPSFDAADPSVILLDILLPGIDGLEGVPGASGGIRACRF